MIPHVGRAAQVFLIAVLGLISIVAILGFVNSYDGSFLWFFSVLLLAFLFLFLIFFLIRAVDRLDDRWFLLMVTGLAAGLRFFWIFWTDNKQVSDFAIYHELAVALITGKGYAITGPVGLEDMALYLNSSQPLPYTTAYRVPGVPLWAAMIYSVFGSNPMAFQVSNVLLGTATVLILFFSLKRTIFHGQARLAALLWAVAPTPVMASNLVCTEILFVFFLMAAAWAINAMDPEQIRPGMFALIGFLLGMAALMRSMLLILVAAVILVYFIKMPARRLVPLLVLIGTMALTISPWTVRNWNAFRSFIPITTNEGIALCIGTRRSLPANPSPLDHEYEEWKAIDNEVLKSQAGYRLAKKNVKAILECGPVYIGKVAFFGLARLFSHDAEILSWSYYMGQQKARPQTLFILHALVTAFYIIVLLSAFWGICRTCLPVAHLPAGFLFLGFFFLIGLLPHILMQGQARWHYMWMPFLTILASAGLSPIFKKLESHMAEA